MSLGLPGKEEEQNAEIDAAMRCGKEIVEDMAIQAAIDAAARHYPEISEKWDEGKSTAPAVRLITAVKDAVSAYNDHSPKEVGRLRRLLKWVTNTSQATTSSTANVKRLWEIKQRVDEELNRL